MPTIKRGDLPELRRLALGAASRVAATPIVFICNRRAANQPDVALQTQCAAAETLLTPTRRMRISAMTRIRATYADLPAIRQFRETTPPPGRLRTAVSVQTAFKTKRRNARFEVVRQRSAFALKRTEQIIELLNRKSISTLYKPVAFVVPAALTPEQA